MNFDQRVAYVERLSMAAAASPRLYELRVMAWILFGYALLAALLALALSLAGGIVAFLIVTEAVGLIVFAWIPLTIAWLLVRALIVRSEPLSGRPVHASEAPKLFAVVNDIRKSLKVPRLDAVILVADVNAGVMESPRFGGLLGWRRHLMIGLPLLMILSTDELRAALAHEMGHLSARHGRLGAWSWRVRASWIRLYDSMSTRSDVIARSVRRLVTWYMDRMMAVTLVSARSQELAADRSSVEITSAASAAAALARSSAAPDVLDRELWDPIWERALDSPAPTASPMDELLNGRMEMFDRGMRSALEKAVNRSTQHDDSHPALAERFAAMGVPAPELATPETWATDELVPTQIRGWISEFDRAWRQSILESWEERHADLKRASTTRSELSEIPPSELTDDQVRDLAYAIELLERPEDAVPILAPIAAARPEVPGVAFMYGSALIRNGDMDGIGFLARAMELDWKAVLPACELVYPFLRERGMTREAEEWKLRYDQQLVLIESARMESSQLEVSDDLRRGSPSDELRDALQLALRDAPWVARAWLVEKQLRSLDHAVRCLVVRAGFGRYVGSDSLNRLAMSLPPQESILVFYAGDGSLIRRLDKLGAAL